MKAIYRFPLNRHLALEDHWPVSLLGGICRMVEEDGEVIAIELTKEGLPLTYAPSFSHTPTLPVKGSITGRDDFLIEARDHIRAAFNFLQCFFDTSIKIGEVEVAYELEAGENDRDLPVTGISFGEKAVGPLSITYDFVTRALMAVEKEEPPEFVSSLAMLAREALTAKRYIDSFRFSFLLIEALFGNGKFREKELSPALLSSPELKNAIDFAVSSVGQNRIRSSSETIKFLNSRPDHAAIIGHLISMRGHYFHGNIKKRNSWSAAKQDEAEGLAWFCMDIVLDLSSNAATPMFKPEYEERHYNEAGENGAHVVMRMELNLRPTAGERLRRRQINLRMPGTKVTTTMTMEAIRETLRLVREDDPEARLHSMKGYDDQRRRCIFELRLHVEPDDPPADG